MRIKRLKRGGCRILPRRLSLIMTLLEVSFYDGVLMPEGWADSDEMMLVYTYATITGKLITYER